MDATIEPISRTEFEQAAAELGVRHPFKDARCLAEYRANPHGPSNHSINPPYDRLMIARGAALAAEGYTAPAHTTTAGTGFAHRELRALTGLSSSGGGDCHYCGLDESTCDCR